MNGNQSMKIARVAGLLYLIFIVFSFLADQLAVFAMTDSTTIYDRIIADQFIFSIGLIFNLFSALFFVLAAWALYALLKPVNESIALLFLILNLIGVAIQSISVLNLFAGMQFFRGTEFINLLQAPSQGMLYIFMYKDGFMLAQIFFGAWLFPLGYLVYKSNYLPKWLGVLLIMDCFGILLWFLQYFLLPNNEAISIPFLIISVLAEFGLTFWLLIKGVKSLHNEK